MAPGGRARNPVTTSARAAPRAIPIGVASLSARKMRPRATGGSVSWTLGDECVRVVRDVLQLGHHRKCLCPVCLER